MSTVKLRGIGLVVALFPWFWSPAAVAQCRGGQQAASQTATTTAPQSSLFASPFTQSGSVSAAAQQQQWIALQQLAYRNAMLRQRLELERQQRAAERRQLLAQQNALTVAQVEAMIERRIAALEESSGELAATEPPARPIGLAQVRNRTERQAKALRTVLDRLEGRRITPAQASAQAARIEASLK